jgi:hypothetical protein
MRLFVGGTGSKIKLKCEGASTTSEEGLTSSASWMTHLARKGSRYISHFPVTNHQFSSLND